MFASEAGFTCGVSGTHQLFIHALFIDQTLSQPHLLPSTGWR